MKKLYTILLLTMLCVPLFSQETKINEKSLADMSFDELQAYQKVLKTQQRNAPSIPEPSKLKEYAEVGKAFGQVFKECWSTISNDAERFAQSPAGKWAMVLVSWKIMGQDAISVTKYAVRWTVGIGLLLVGVPFWIFIFWRNCVSKRILISTEKTGLFSYKKVYSEKMSIPIHEDYGKPILYAITFAVFIGILCLIMFV